MTRESASYLRRRLAVEKAYFSRYAEDLVSRECGIAEVVPEARVVCTPEGNPVKPRALSRWWRSARAQCDMAGWKLSDVRSARAQLAALDAEAGR